MKRLKQLSIWLIIFAGWINATDTWAKARAYFVHVDPSIRAGEVWKVKIDIIDAQPGETFTYEWQSGFPQDNQWVRLDDNDVYSGTRTPEFGFKTKVGATEGFKLPFRCKIVGSKSGKFYSSNIMMPDPISSESGGKASAYVIHVDPSIYAGEVWKVKLGILNAQPGETFTYEWQSGFPHDNQWVTLDDNDVYGGTHTPEFGFKTKVGATDGFPIPFRCKIVGSKSGKFYSSNIMMPNPIPDKDHPTAGGYVEGYPKFIGNDAIEVKWYHAEDNVTPPSRLMYYVVWKKKTSSDWNWSKGYRDITSFTIRGLDLNTAYEVTVFVEDESGNGKYYGHRTVSTDNMLPEPGCDGKIGLKAVTPTTIEIFWCRAKDNMTAERELGYSVELEDPGTSGFHTPGWGIDILSYTYKNLRPSSTYKVRVTVRDKEGNAAHYNVRTIKTQAKAPEEPKLTNKTLSVTGKTDHSVSLRWNAATCGSLPHAEIIYSIVYRPKNETMWRRSTILYGKTEHTVTGLAADTEYKFRVLVFRKSMTVTNVYTDIAEARTDKLVDNTKPVFGDDAKISVDEVTETSITLSWPKATDDQTSEEKMRYTVLVKGNGYRNPKLCLYPFKNLTPDTKYNFGVYAFDEAGNWSKPLETSVTTKNKVVPDTEPPYFPNGQELSVTATETSLDVSWPAAADKVTATNNLLYKIHFSPSDEWIWPVTSLGKNVLSHTFNGLQPDTEYDICVTVYDAAANSADYTWKMKVKTKASNQTVHPASVSIAPASLDLETGNKATLTATVLPANAKDKSVTWSSNLPAIASVDAVTGEVTALAVGKAEITATANDKAGGTKSETVEVRVKAKKVRKLVTDVSVMPAAHTLTEGDIFYYTGIVQPDDADNKALTWTSSDPTVATVSKGGGFINALKAGTTTITATADDGSGKYGQSILTVKAPGGMVGATGIVVYQTEIQLPKNGTATLTARVLPGNATNKGFTWSSSNPAVASVSSDGVVTAHLPGATALITATADDGGWTDFCTIHVEGTSVTLSPSAFTLEVGESIELTATTEPWDSPMTKSFSSNRFRVAEVDKNGVVKAKAVGDATITVTLSGGQQANCYITVKKGENAPDANELIVDDSNARVWAADGILYVSTEQATDVEVINFSGLLLKKFKAPTGTTPVKYLPAGFYVVRVGQQTTKVVIR